MSVAALFNVPGTPEEFAQWGFANAAHHTDIVRRIYEITGQSLQSYVLDPIPQEISVWLYQHQFMHQQMDVVLGISGFDLTDVDWRDKGQLEGWITSHANEHVQASNILGLG